jgi:hypothetical protein
MKIPVFFGLLLLFIGFDSCKTDDNPSGTEGSLTIHFKATYNGQTLPMFLTEPFTNPEQLQFSHLSFLVSDLALLDQSTPQTLKDVELVDLSFDNATNADEGYTVHIDNIPVKNYTGFRFGVGVPQDMNTKTPADFPSTSPLSKSTYYWSAWNSYIFMKTEGHIDTLGNGSFNTGFAYHTGTNKLYRIATWTAPISIEDGKNKEVDIEIDFKTVLAGIDIKSMPLNSNPEDSVQITHIVQNLANALSLVQ